MAVQNENGVKYAEMTDEIITDIAKGIELFVKDEEYWAKFAHLTPVNRGAKTFSYRRLVKPRVRQEDVHESAEYIAPRPSKFAVQTFEKTIKIYRDKAIYSKEDLMYHFDDTVNNLRATLQEIVRQKKEFIYGLPFVQSACTVTPESTLIATLEKTAIILRKNDAKRWDGVHYLAHITPEMLKQIRAEVRALGQTISEPTKKELDSVATALGSWGDWTFSVSTSPLLYKDDTHQVLVMMGKRGIDGNSPVDISKMKGESDLEVINNGLGSGVLVDEDGNYTADDNKQQGSLAININGVGSAVNDDLCIIDCVVTVDTIKGSLLNYDEMTGHKEGAGSPASFLSVKAVDKDGGAIASPTVTVNKLVKGAVGGSVSASSGKYPVVAGDTYRVSVAKSGYTTVTMDVTANAGANTYTFVLVTA